MTYWHILWRYISLILYMMLMIEQGDLLLFGRVTILYSMGENSVCSIINIITCQIKTLTRITLCSIKSKFVLRRTFWFCRRDILGATWDHMPKIIMFIYKIVFKSDKIEFIFIVKNSQLLLVCLLRAKNYSIPLVNFEKIFI